MPKWHNENILQRCILAIAVCVVVSWVLYGMFGYRAIEAIYKSESSLVVNMIMRGRSITPLQDYLKGADTLMLVGTLRAFAIIIFLVLALKSPWMPLYAGVSVLLMVFIIYGSIEIYPPLADMLHLNGVDYYSYRKIFTPDPLLVYKMKPFLHFHTHESHDPLRWGVEAPRTASDWTTDEEGFRNGGGSQFSDIVIVGDGMINSGLSWEDTFSKRLESHLPGWSVRNLGISGHGPFQYVEVLQTYGIKRKPQYAILSFNEGNDIQDIGKYLQWKSGSSRNLTGGYESGITTPLLKFTTAFSQTFKYLQDESWLLAETALLKPFGHDAYFRSLPADLASVRLPTNRTFPIAFIDKQNTQSSGEIQKTENWKEFKALLIKFKKICVEHRIAPIILFIPTAAHIYAEHSTDQSGANWLKIRDQQIGAKANLETAIVRLSGDLSIKYLSLTPAFQTAARSGLQLFDSFSVHMTSQGTEVGGAYVARALQSETIADAVKTRKHGQTVESRARIFPVNSVRAH